MAREPLRKKFAQKVNNGFGTAALILTGMAVSAGTVFTLTGDRIDLDHNGQREDVIQTLNQRFDQLENHMTRNAALQQQFDMAALNNDISERNKLSQDIDRNARTIRWLSQEYASVMLKSEAIHEGDFRDFAQRFQNAGFDKQTAIVIDPDYAEWRDQARTELPLNPRFADYLAMSKDMEARAENRYGATGFAGFVSLFPLLFLTLIFGSDKMGQWERLPSLPDRPEKPSRLQKLVGRGRKHNH